MTNPAPGYKMHPKHKITIKPTGYRVVITIDGKQIGATDDALLLKEDNYSPVYYLSISALPANMLKESDHSTYCPFKGEAGYFHLLHEGKTHENAIWVYRAPYDEAGPIRDYIAIYPNVATVSPA